MCLQSSRQTVGDYHVLHTIGTGATGKVKLGRHVTTGEYVALKFVNTRVLRRNYAQYSKFRREIAILKYLSGAMRSSSPSSPSTPSSPGVGVLRLLDVYDERPAHMDGVVVLVLEHCNGGDLFDMIVSNGLMSPAVALDYFQQLVYALDFCHRRGIVHRDLKLENILLSHTAPGGKPLLKLADFGFSSVQLDEAVLLQTSCGTMHYCAPEVLRGDQYSGARSDVWSLGVILFIMVTGGLPFDDESTAALLAKICSGSFYMPPEMPAPIASLLRHMLQPDPAERATLQDVMQSEWFTSTPVAPHVLTEQPHTGRDDTSVASTTTMASNAVKMACSTTDAVEHPDTDVVTQLADLGMGDTHNIKFRLRQVDACKEKDMYHVLCQYRAQSGRGCGASAVEQAGAHGHVRVHGHGEVGHGEKLEAKSVMVTGQDKGINVNVGIDINIIVKNNEGDDKDYSIYATVS